jgi:DNA (cytosine-5)-methyltransferase 3A
MNVLSLFDGISCCRVALARVGIEVKNYYASEIEKNAMKVSAKNYPDIIQVGSVVDLKSVPEPIDLLVGGSPCQDLSIAKKGRKGLEGDRSGLFWEYVRLLKDLKPKWFILENVASMPKADRDIITKEMGVEPILINASLVSAQCRKRLFWTNIPNVGLPVDRGILLKDILQPDAEVDERMVVKGKAFCLTSSYSKVSPSEAQVNNSVEKKQRTMVRGASLRGRKDKEGKWVDKLDVRKDDKVSALTTTMSSKLALVKEETRIRKLTPIECERLQGLPDDYTSGIAMTNRYKCIGNAFNVDVVAHILHQI